MKILSRIIVFITVAVCAVSCFEDGPTYSSSYTLNTTFEYRDASFNADSLYFDNKNGVGIGWEDLAFFHKTSGDKSQFLGGFILSAKRGGGEGNDMFRVNSGAGYKNSNAYMVYLDNPDDTQMPKNDIEFSSKDYGTCKMLGCFVNNTKETVNAVKSTFTVGDRLILKMTGYLNGTKTGEREYVLAEFTEQKDSIVTQWSPFDLAKLGLVDCVELDVVSTRPDTPTSVCLENFVATIEVSF